MTQRSLTLPLKSVYFKAIKAGEKTEEFRLRTPYWRNRLEKMRPGDVLTLTLGYPRREWTDCRMTIPWAGMRETTITHPHFGPAPVEVFAINVRAAAALADPPAKGKP